MAQFKKQTVQIFLAKYKAAAKESFSLIPRQENMNTLSALGLTLQDCEAEIMSLSVADYCKGPENDKNKAKGGTVWFFGKSINGREVYIKIKLIETETQKKGVCLSFHFANTSLKYPFR